jgi:hypothetical protein
MGKDCDTEDRRETDTLDWAKLQKITKGMHRLQHLETKEKDNQQKKTPNYQYLALLVYPLKWVLGKGGMLGWEHCCVCVTGNLVRLVAS